MYQKIKRIAAEILGWHVDKIPNDYTGLALYKLASFGDDDDILAVATVDRGLICEIEPVKFNTEIKDAWRVVRGMRDLGFFFQIYSSPTTNTYKVCFGKVGFDDMWGVHESECVAIIDTALAAMDMINKEKQ